MSKTSTFFAEIEHSEVPWRSYQLHVPVFYYDTMSLSVYLLAPTERIKTILPSKRLHPYRVTPSLSTVLIAAYSYQDCDLGPYNEVMICVPVTLDKATPMFTGSLRRPPPEPIVYIHSLPVTTEIARVVGAEFAGYPKFVAEIDFVDEGDWVHCKWVSDNEHVLTLRGRKLPLKPTPRSRVHALTHRRGYILRSESISGKCEMGLSRDAQDVELKLGEHRIAQELRDLGAEKTSAYAYCPHKQHILTPVIESYAV